MSLSLLAAATATAAAPDIVEQFLLLADKVLLEALLAYNHRLALLVLARHAELAVEGLVDDDPGVVVAEHALGGLGLAEVGLGARVVAVGQVVAVGAVDVDADGGVVAAVEDVVGVAGRDRVCHDLVEGAGLAAQVELWEEEENGVRIRDETFGINAD